MADNEAQKQKTFAEIVATLLRTMPYRIVGQWYYRQTVVFDGFTFVRCRFDACTISVSRGLFLIEHCYFSGCQFIFADEALGTVRLYNILNPEMRLRHPQLVPTYHEDGTLSVVRLL